MHSPLQGSKCISLRISFANRLALAVGSKTQHPSFYFKAKCSRSLALHQAAASSWSTKALLKGRRSMSWSTHFLMYSRNPARIPSLHVSAASRAPGVPSASVVSALSQGCVDLRSRSSRCGMQCDALSKMDLLKSQQRRSHA